MGKRTRTERQEGCAREVTEVVSHFAAFGLSGQTEARLRDVLLAFAAYAERGHRIQRVEDVDESIARSFIGAPTKDGAIPSSATMHFRRGALRLLFRIARHLSLATGDPTLDIELPPRSSLPLRPLTNDEVVLCRSVVLASAVETRLPAAWALGEATATSAELGLIKISDVQLTESIVRLPGATKADPRYGVPTAWGLAQLARRVNACKARQRELLLYEGRSSAQSRHAAGCIAISETLRRAGLGREPDVGPTSLRAWAGVEIFRQTGSIDAVARRLGMRSIDRAAALIGWDWRKDPA